MKTYYEGPLARIFLRSQRRKSVLRITAGFLTAAVLAGCAVTSRESLPRNDRPEQIILTEKVSYVSHAINGTRWEHIALPGTYEAERKDDNGVYFYGPGRSIVQIGQLYKNVPRLKVGGIYLPNDTSQPAQIIWAFETQVQTATDLDQYIRDRTVTTTAMPALSPGIGTGANIVGNVVAGALVGAMLEHGVGEVTRVIVKDASVSAKFRSARSSSELSIPATSAGQ